MSAPFRFWTFYGLVRITGDRAETPGALRDLIAQCPPACLFFHTFQVVRDRHFVRDQYPNDFAEWVLTSVRDEALAERLAGLDVRMCRSIDELREQTMAVFDHHFRLHPRASGREAREPFFLLQTQAIHMPTQHEASDPLRFAAELRRVSIRSVAFHFIEARLRLHLHTNDFSQYMRGLGLERVAEQIDALDFYTNTLFELRERIATVVEQGVRQ